MDNHCYNYIRNKAVGMKLGATWGTAIEPAANDGLFLTGSTLAQGAIVKEDNQEESGRGFPSESFSHAYEPQNMNLQGRFYTEGCEFPVALAMGAEAQTGVGPYVKTYSLEKCLTGKFVTLSWDEETQVKSLDSASLNMLTLSIDGGLRWSADFMGNKTTDQSGWTVPSGVTYPSSGKKYFLLKQAVCRINDESDAALAVGDVVEITDFTYVIKRGHVPAEPQSGQDYTDEPPENNSVEITGTLTFRTKSVQNRDFFADYSADTHKKMDIIFTGASPYVLAINTPKFYLNEAPVYDFDSPTPVTLTFKVLDAAAAPTGMDETTPYIVSTNDLDTTYLS